MTDPSALRKSCRTAMIVAAAMIVSLVLYVVVVELFRATGAASMPILQGQTAMVVRYAFYGFAILQVIIIRVMRGLLFHKSPGLDAEGLAKRLSMASIMTSVFAEVPALLGVVLFFLMRATRDFYALLFVSLVLMFMFFPRYRSWEEWVASEQGKPPAQPPAS